MSNYIKLSTLEYPRHEGDIRKDHPELDPSLTGDLFSCPPTYALVEQTSLPEYDDNTQIVEAVPPKLVEGKWIATWTVRDLTSEELNERKILQELKVLRPTSGQVTEIEAATSSEGQDNTISTPQITDLSEPVFITPLNP